MNMLDLLRSAQGGNGIENLARQFGLGQDQTESVLKHVLPAVSTGFKQRSRNQDGLAGILKSIQGTDYEDVYQDGNSLHNDNLPIVWRRGRSGQKDAACHHVDGLGRDAKTGKYPSGCQ